MVYQKLKALFTNTAAAQTTSLSAELPIMAFAALTMLIITLSSILLSPLLQPDIAGSGQVQGFYLVASTGASILLVFILPTSPVSQPYSLLGGHLISAIIGIFCAQLMLPLYISAPLCISLCIFAMYLLKCIHPPGGATAMMPILVGSEALGGFGFVLFPVFLNMALLVGLAILFHRYWLKQSYPSIPAPKKDPLHNHGDASPLSRLGISQDDLAGALKQFDAYLNISKHDLAQVFGLAQQNVYQRKFGEIRCSDIMTRDVKVVRPDTALEEAWALLRYHKIKLLPVVDINNKVLGIISLVDFLKRADIKHYDGFGERLSRFIKQDPVMAKGLQPLRVAEIMVSPAYTAQQDELIATLVPLLSDKGLHHIPIVNHNDELAGMVTQSDLVAALYVGAVRT